MQRSSIHPATRRFPAHNQQLLIPSHGVGLNALLFVAGGRGPHPTVILMHGLPGNERNLDLAQAIRRCGLGCPDFHLSRRVGFAR